jgi:DNA replication and repair protein RecF
MAEHGVAAAAARIETLARLRDALYLASDTHFPRADIALSGELEMALVNASAIDVEENFRKNLARMRRRDAAAGRTLNGLHRSDLSVHHATKKLAAHLCSTGEQKALLISIVLANARLLVALGQPPLLLLDEVAAHLDVERRCALFEEILGLNIQAFMTGTDQILFVEFGARAQTFRIVSSVVQQIS